MTPTTSESSAALITEAVRLSGLSLPTFARQILSRDRRTVLRWSQGHVIPPIARAWLQAWIHAPASTRATIVRLLA